MEIAIRLGLRWNAWNELEQNHFGFSFCFSLRMRLRKQKQIYAEAKHALTIRLMLLSLLVFFISDLRGR
jgi:hypothetical protein